MVFAYDMPKLLNCIHSPPIKSLLNSIKGSYGEKLPLGDVKLGGSMASVLHIRMIPFTEYKVLNIERTWHTFSYDRVNICHYFLDGF